MNFPITYFTFDDKYVLLCDESDICEMNILPKVLISIVYGYYDETDKQVYLVFKHNYNYALIMGLTESFEHLLKISSVYDIKYFFNCFLISTCDREDNLFERNGFVSYICEHKHENSCHTYYLKSRYFSSCGEILDDCGVITIKDEDIPMITNFIKTVYKLYSEHIIKSQYT